jgi:hypothetical protein
VSAICGLGKIKIFPFFLFVLEDLKMKVQKKKVFVPFEGKVVECDKVIFESHDYEIDRKNCLKALNKFGYKTNEIPKGSRILWDTIRRREIVWKVMEIMHKHNFACDFAAENAYCDITHRSVGENCSSVWFI